MIDDFPRSLSPIIYLEMIKDHTGREPVETVKDHPKSPSADW